MLIISLVVKPDATLRDSTRHSSDPRSAVDLFENHLFSGQRNQSG